MKASLWFIFTLYFSSNIALAEINKTDPPQKSMPRLGGINFHDYIITSFYDTEATANRFLIRAATPHSLGSISQAARLTIPYNSYSDSLSNTSASGLGDINLFNVFLFGDPDLQFGIGPMVTFPTASSTKTGAQKWQLGVASTLLQYSSLGIFGMVFTYQHQIGESTTYVQNLATLQPIVIYNLPHNFSLRSTGIWVFDWQSGNYFLPVGLGLGRNFKLAEGTSVSAFIEPQWTVAHQGRGAPNYQTFVGLNFILPFMN